MPPANDAYVFPEPWLDLRGHSSDAAAGRGRMERELLLEVGYDNPLVQQPVEAIAHFTRQDEMLFRTANGYVIAHLTWARRRDPFTVLRPFGDWDAVVREVEADRVLQRR